MTVKEHQNKSKHFKTIIEMYEIDKRLVIEYALVGAITMEELSNSDSNKKEHQEKKELFKTILEELDNIEP